MKNFGIILTLFIFSGCVGMGGLGSLQKAERLQLGMSTATVEQVLGSKPYATKIVGGKIYWKYKLHKWGYGWVPFYLRFDKQNQILEDWYVHEGEYFQNQEMWIGVANAINTTSQLYTQNQFPQKNQTVYTPAHTPYVAYNNLISGNSSYAQTVYTPTNQATVLTQAQAEEIVRKQWMANLAPSGAMADMDYNTNSEFRQRVDELTGKMK